MNKLGYSVNSNALEVIEMCDNWYSNRIIENFHKRKNLNDKEVELSRINFAKRCCADDANLCEIVSVAPEKESKSQEFIDKVLSDNRFDVRYREQLEKTSATGTVGAYIYLRNAEYVQGKDGVVTARGGEIRINYCDADCIIPLTVENNLVSECAFYGTNIVRGKERTTLVIFTAEKGKYKAETVVFDEHGQEIKVESSTIQLGEVKPFAIMTNAEVNNLDDMEGYGLPKVNNAIPYFKAVDLCFNILYGDLDKGEKVVFLNELLACLQTKNDGTQVLTPQQKDLFVLLGEKLPQQDTLIKEYNPEIRVDAITKAFELVLSLLSMQFGYGTKKYTFENGQIKTATEYIGAKQDAMQELNKQRKQASDYITDILRAAMWFSNSFCKTSYNVDEALSIQFDDSYIEDKAAKLESMRADAVTFQDIPWLTFMYIKTKYNLSDEEAEKYINEGKVREEPNEDLED